MGIDDRRLRAFVRESNAIEGIARRPTAAEVEAHRRLLQLDGIRVADLTALVAVLQPNAELRDRPEVPGVRVGNHVAPPSGPLIRARLEDVLARANGLGVDDTPYAVHAAYETLHPFTDGNGRSGRALWLWMMLEAEDPLWAYGFLRAWYYQSLAEARR